MNELDEIAARAAQTQKKIVLPEGGDARVLQAAAQVTAQGLAEVWLLGERAQLMALAQAEGIDSRVFEQLHLLDPQHNQRAEQHADILLRARRHKGLSRQAALTQVREPLTLGACLLAAGEVDGCVAGAVHTTSDVVRAGLQIVGVRANEDDGDDDNGGGLVSSFFIMRFEHPHQALRGAAVFADCALVIEPDAAQLAQIAIDTADSAAALLQLKPRVALLSFSTAGSARHPQVDKVRRAGDIIARRRPDIELLAEVQFDAAVSADILARKAPAMVAAGTVAAPANIFIFPDLQSANIGYKIAERIGAAEAVGPILQGLRRPLNDLSRGCAVEDIVKLVAVTAVQAQAVGAR